MHLAVRSLITPSQLQILQHLTMLADVEFSRSQFLCLAEFKLRRTACCADYKAAIDRVCAAEKRGYSWNAQLLATRYYY